MRPGLHNITTMLAKLVARRPMYRYGIEDLAEGGAMSTEVKMPVGGMGAELMVWNSESSRWMGRLASSIEKDSKIPTVYILPLGLFQPEAADAARTANGEFLALTPPPIQPIPDSALGVATNPEDFSDSAQHVTEEARKERTSTIGGILKPALPKLK